MFSFVICGWWSGLSAGDLLGPVTVDVSAVACFGADCPWHSDHGKTMVIS